MTNCFDMGKRVYISLKIEDENGKFIPLDELEVAQLKQIRFRLLVEAGKIKQKIYDLTGEIMDES